MNIFGHYKEYTYTRPASNVTQDAAQNASIISSLRHASDAKARLLAADFKTSANYTISHRLCNMQIDIFSTALYVVRWGIRLKKLVTMRV